MLGTFELIPADSLGWFSYGESGSADVALRWKDLFSFVVRADGREIVGAPGRNATAESFETHLLSQVLSTALLLMGREPIHATVLDTPAGGVGFLGDSGFGKSSLAAAFLHGGDRLVTDDLLLTAHRAGVARVHPGPARLKLFPHVARRFLGKDHVGTPVNDRTSKAVVPLAADQVASSPVPLRALYALRGPAKGSSAKRISIRSMSRSEAFLELTKGSFNSLVVKPKRLKVQFRESVLLAEEVPVRWLSYPAGHSELMRVRERVLQDLAG